MSWSVAAVGKAPAVRTEINRQFDAAGACSEPEETVRQAAKAAIDAALAGQDPSRVVRVSANGSQAFTDWTAKTGVFNNLSIQIEPLSVFFE